MQFLPAGAGLRIAGSLNLLLLHPTNHWRLLEARNTLEHRLLRSLRMTLSMLEVGWFKSHDSWLTTDIIIKGQWLLSDLINVRGRISHDSMLGLGWLKSHDSWLITGIRRVEQPSCWLWGRSPLVIKFFYFIFSQSQCTLVLPKWPQTTMIQSHPPQDCHRTLPSASPGPDPLPGSLSRGLLHLRQSVWADAAPDQETQRPPFWRGHRRGRQQRLHCSWGRRSRQRRGSRCISPQGCNVRGPIQ